MPRQRKVPTLNYFDKPRDKNESSLPNIGDDYQAEVPDLTAEDLDKLKEEEKEKAVEDQDTLLWSPEMAEEFANDLFFGTQSARPPCQCLTPEEITYLKQFFNNYRVSDVRMVKPLSKLKKQQGKSPGKLPKDVLEAFTAKYNQLFNVLRGKFPPKKWTAVMEWYFDKGGGDALALAATDKEKELASEWSSFYELVIIKQEEDWPGDSIEIPIPKDQIWRKFSTLRPGGSSCDPQCPTCNLKESRVEDQSDIEEVASQPTHSNPKDPDSQPVNHQDEDVCQGSSNSRTSSLSPIRSCSATDDSETADSDGSS